jgi:hypothetical protein
VTLSHRLDFGDRHQHRLDSEVNYYDQRGTFDIERFRWREILRLFHTEDLKSWYHVELMDREQGVQAGVPPLKEISFLISGTVEHRLFESLVSQLYAFYQRQDFDGSPVIDRWAVQANFDYRKKNPWGELLMHFLTRYQQEDRSGSVRRIAVDDERRTFRDPEPIVLNQPNIDPATILVVSEDRITVYQSGRDYRVRDFADRTELERVPTGLIADGQTVLINYQFEFGSDYKLDSINYNFGVRQDFAFGLSPYYRLRWQDQSLSPSDAIGVVPDDIRDHILGLEYRYASFRFVAEYEDYDSQITPFEVVRLSLDYTHRFKFGATGILKARWSDYDYSAPNERELMLFTIEGRYRHPITEHLTVEGAILYRNEDDSLSGRNEGLDFDLSLEWLIRETEVRMTLEHGRFEDNFAKNDTTAFYLQVRRWF